jgi:hypothetical protein
MAIRACENKGRPLCQGYSLLESKSLVSLIRSVVHVYGDSAAALAKETSIFESYLSAVKELCAAVVSSEKVLNDGIKASEHALRKL